jgi:vacuolar-type H+-ATPase subunit C/Vma6
MQVIVGVGFIALIISELVAVTHSSLKKSEFAFLAPRILNSKIVSFASNLDLLMQQRKKSLIQDKASNFDLKLVPQKRTFSNLKEVEQFIISEYEDSFNRFFFFLPENLKNFFERWKILRDFENLKTVLACKASHISAEKCLYLFGPEGKIAHETLSSLGELENIKEVLNSVVTYFPSGTISQIDLTDENVLDYIQYVVDRVAAKYISESCLEVKIQNPEKIRKLVTKKYEIQDIITIARLKRYNIPPRMITPLLIDQQSELTDIEFKNLLLAKNYRVFNSIISQTYYREILKNKYLNPRKLEEILQRSFFKELTKQAEDIGENLVIRFMIGLEYCFPIIWKALIFSIIDWEDKE